MAPHAPPGAARLPFDVLVLIAVGGNRVPFANEPFPDVPAVAEHGADRPAVPVGVLDGDAYLLAADLLDQRALDLLAVPEPVAVLVACPLIPFGRVDAGKAYFAAGDPDAVAVGDIGLAGKPAGRGLGVGCAAGAAFISLAGKRAALGPGAGCTTRAARMGGARLPAARACPEQASEQNEDCRDGKEDTGSPLGWPAPSGWRCETIGREPLRPRRRRTATSGPPDAAPTIDEMRMVARV